MRPEKSITYAVVAAVVSFAFGSTSLAATMDFDSLALGTVFGSTAVPVPHTPGEPVFSQDFIDMSVEELLVEGLPGFLYAEVGGRFGVPDNPLELNNIAVRFDFTNLGFDVDLVTIEFWEFGPLNNLAANGGTIHELFSLQDIDGAIVASNPDVTATVSDNLLTLTGDIDSVRIGGQELVIDNITAIPEPATVMLLGAVGAIVFMRRKPPLR
jgi:hypothetical protein